MSLLLLLRSAVPSAGVVAHGTRSPIRVPKGKPRLRYNGPQRLGQRVSADEAITATGTVAFGLAVTATGTVTVTGTAALAFGLAVSGAGNAGAAPSGLTARGTRRPVRTVKSRRVLRTNGPQRLSGLSYPPPITGTAALAFGLAITGTGTVSATTGPGLIRALLTYRARHGADLAYTIRHQGDATYQPRHGADLTHVTRHGGDLTYATKD